MGEGRGVVTSHPSPPSSRSLIWRGAWCRDETLPCLPFSRFPHRPQVKVLEEELRKSVKRRRRLILVKRGLAPAGDQRAGQGQDLARRHHVRQRIESGQGPRAEARAGAGAGTEAESESRGVESGRGTGGGPAATDHHLYDPRAPPALDLSAVASAEAAAELVWGRLRDYMAEQVERRPLARRLARTRTHANSHAIARAHTHTRVPLIASGDIPVKPHISFHTHSLSAGRHAGG